MIIINQHISLNPSEIKFSFTTSQGPGGQNVNKVATAVQLRFDVLHSPSLPEEVRQRLIGSLGNKLTEQGELIIRASCYRSQERNKQDALSRLCQLIERAAIRPKKRRKIKPSYSSKQKKMRDKKLQGQKKELRRIR